MTSIATLTLNPALDSATQVDRVVPDEKLRCTRPEVEPGGGGINVARVVARLGGSAVAVYPAGGPPGRHLHELLEDEGVDSRPVTVREPTRTNLHVSESDTESQYRFVMPGGSLAEDEWRRCLAAATSLGAGYLVASGSLPPDVPDDLYARMVREAPDDCRVVVDTSGPALRAVANAGAYLLKPNASELRDLCGDLREEADLENAAEDLVDSGAADAVLLSLGAGGAYLAVRGGKGHALRAPTVPIRSRVGAGDSMVGGIVTALARGCDLIEAARFGLAAGAAAVMTPGTQLCRREDTERLYEREQPQ
ncbi:MAG: 1-phosphofructokinase family hexose kinase [Actinobacteria bacterium]|nr:1-phosphofructokinase family hexose kinase [Actinomycetota bacterium]